MTYPIDMEANFRPSPLDPNWLATKSKTTRVATYGFPGRGLGTFQDAYGADASLSEMTTSIGPTRWDGDTLYLLGISNATIAPVGGNVTVRVSKEKQVRSCSDAGGCGGWKAWTETENYNVKVLDKKRSTIYMDQDAYKGVVGRHPCSWGNPNQCYEDQQFRWSVKLVSWVSTAPPPQPPVEPPVLPPPEINPNPPADNTIPTQPTSLLSNPLLILGLVGGVASVAVVGVLLAMKGSKKTEEA